MKAWTRTTLLKGFRTTTIRVSSSGPQVVTPQRRAPVVPPIQSRPLWGSMPWTFEQSSSRNNGLVLPDSIFLTNLQLRGTLGLDSWERNKVQPLVVSLAIHSDTRQAGISDLVGETVHYGIVAKAVEKLVAERCTATPPQQQQNDRAPSSFRLTAVEELAECIAKAVLFDCGAESVFVQVKKPRALLHAASAGVEITRKRSDYNIMTGSGNLSGTESIILPLKLREDYIFVEDLRLDAIIGVNPWERKEKQVININFGVYPFEQLEGTTASSSSTTRSRRRGPSSIPAPQNFRILTRLVIETVGSTAYKTVEALASHIARACILQGGAKRVRIRISKPSAIVFADGAGVEVERTSLDFNSETTSLNTASSSTSSKTLADPMVQRGPNNASDSSSSSGRATSSNSRIAYLGLGSNIGDRALNIERARQCFSTTPHCQVVGTSHLYETPAMYKTDQPPFYNAVIALQTSLNPDELLGLAKSIERQLGRIKTVDKGPRTIDVDILLIEGIESHSTMTNHGPLRIPHLGIEEREFVLRPLLDVLQGPFELKMKYSNVLSSIQSAKTGSPQNSSSITQILPWMEKQAATVNQRRDEPHWKIGTETFLMGILNVTPDSFSDGGDYYLNVQSAVAAAERMVKSGADILDIGGQSTRPGANEITATEELDRVLPVIRAIRSHSNLQSTLISIDTFRADVAQAAIEAGADMINDVSGGQRDAKMFGVAAQLAVPICIMHSKGTSSTMNGLTNYNGDVVTQVGQWLLSRAEEAMRTGIARWNIILDPGIGFAKTTSQNLELLRNLDRLLEHHPESSPLGQTGSPTTLSRFPLLLGTSRKQFIGKLTSRSEAKDRTMGTAATIVAAIQTGRVDIVRVHDVEEMHDVIRVADAIYRTNEKSGVE